MMKKKKKAFEYFLILDCMKVIVWIFSGIVIKKRLFSWKGITQMLRGKREVCYRTWIFVYVHSEWLRQIRVCCWKIWKFSESLIILWFDYFFTAMKVDLKLSTDFCLLAFFHFIYFATFNILSPLIFCYVFFFLNPTSSLYMLLVSKSSKAAIFKAYAKSAPTEGGWWGREREMGWRETEIKTTTTRKKTYRTMAACVRLPGIRLATIYVTSTTTVLSFYLFYSSIRFFESWRIFPRLDYNFSQNWNYSIGIIK